jgi:hypothetical protein
MDFLDTDGFSDAPQINSPNTSVGVDAGSLADFLKQEGGGTYTASIPDVTPNTLWGTANNAFASLLNFQLKRDQIGAQQQLASGARSVYPYGTNPLTGAPNPAPATVTNTWIKYAMVGGLIYAGLKIAQAA